MVCPPVVIVVSCKVLLVVYTVCMLECGTSDCLLLVTVDMGNTSVTRSL